MQREELFSELFGDLDEEEPEADIKSDSWELIEDSAEPSPSAVDSEAAYRPLPWETGGEPWSSHDGAHRTRSQAGGRAVAAVSSPRVEYRRLRRVADGPRARSSGASAGGASASSAAPAVVAEGAVSADVGPAIATRAKAAPRRAPPPTAILRGLKC
jgi:hypothetical protein